MSSLIFNPSDNGIGSVSVNVLGDDKNYNLTLPNTNGTLVSSVNGKTANNNGSVTISELAQWCNSNNAMIVELV